jgi:hypothetical protein
MPSGPAALRGLTHLNVLLTLATEGGGGTVLVSRPRRWHCIVLKVGKEGVDFVWKRDVGVCDVAGFIFVVCDFL